MKVCPDIRERCGASRGSISRSYEGVGKILWYILILTGVCAPRCGATVYNSNGTEANVQTLLNLASDGDTITLPAGIFSWTSRLEITKGITLQGATSMVGPSRSPIVVDAALNQIVDLDAFCLRINGFVE